MKETTIIMSGDHPKKILDGTKTMTRRVIKPCSTATVVGIDGKVSQPDWVFTTAKCPYGQVGDRLWVREGHRVIGKVVVRNKDACGAILLVEYKDGQQIEYEVKEDCLKYADNLYVWKPSLFMPRWASRITLEITGVRVERLQEITLQDIRREGIEGVDVPYLPKTMEESAERHIRNKFIRLWDSLNAKRGFGWDKNPWVWVISFNHGVRLK